MRWACAWQRRYAVQRVHDAAVCSVLRSSAALVHAVSRPRLTAVGAANVRHECMRFRSDSSRFAQERPKRGVSIVRNRGPRLAHESQHERAPQRAPPRDGIEFLYGIHPVSCAIATRSRVIHGAFIVNGAAADRPAHAAIEQACGARGIPVTRADRDTLQRMAPATANNHQGVLLKVDAVPLTSLPALLEPSSDAASPSSLIVVCEGVSDPHNLGAILRSACLFDVDMVVLPHHRSCPITPACSRVSAGAAEVLLSRRRVRVCEHVPTLLHTFRAARWQVLGADMPEEGAARRVGAADAPCQLITDVSVTGPCVLVLGGEGAGLRRATLDELDVRVAVPQTLPQVEESYAAGLRLPDSLNVSVAAAVLMFSLRQKLRRP